MNNLIPINYDNPERPTVSGRELHEFLQVKTAYKDWFPRMVEYGFTEGEDFNPLKIERVQEEGGRKVTRTVDDHQLTIPMAKELCMIQRNERGKQARQYFLAVEAQWNSPEAVMRRAVLIADHKVKELQSVNRSLLAENTQLTAANAELAPKGLFADAVSASKQSILVGDLAKILKQNGVEIGATRLFQWMRDNGYLVRGNRSDKNMPTQRSMKLGLFDIKETVVSHSDGHTTINKTPKVTGKGQVYFVNLFLKRAGAPAGKLVE